MLWVHDHYKYFYSYSTGIDFKRPNLTSRRQILTPNVNPRTVRVKTTLDPLYSKTCPYRNALGTNFYSGLDRFRFGEGFCFRKEQTTITCTISMRVIIQDVSSVGLQVIARLNVKAVVGEVVLSPRR